MTYGAEAIIPLETGFLTSRISSFNPMDNDEQLTKSLDLIEREEGKYNGSIGLLPTKLK